MKSASKSSRSVRNEPENQKDTTIRPTLGRNRTPPPFIGKERIFEISGMRKRI
jgi:hypothetical protein